MQRALSTHLLVNHRLSNVWLDRIWEAGIPLVEIFAARQHLDYHNRVQIAELGHWFRESELKLHSIHSPLHTDEYAGRSGPQVIRMESPLAVHKGALPAARRLLWPLATSTTCTASPKSSPPPAEA